MSDVTWGHLEQTVLRLGYLLARERGSDFHQLFNSDSLRSDMARLEVRRRARKTLPTVTQAQLELAIEECLSP